LALWKEKLVAYWVNQNLHFGVTVTSPIEGCHATLKSYLQRGHGDLRGVFVRLELFWKAQLDSIITIVGQQKLRPKSHTNIPLFAALISQVHGFALEIILVENRKLPATGPPPSSCTCTIQQSHGLPCYHIVWNRKSSGGAILLSDIHPHWHYDQPSSSFNSNNTPESLPLPVLNPVRIKGKGRPKGALGGVIRVAESSTRRHPSAFELPSSSAPVALSFSYTFNQSEAPIGQIYVVNSGLKQPTSTALAIARLADGHIDQYEAGTCRERSYMGGISSVYKDDYISGIEVENNGIKGEGYTQDGEWDLEDLEFT
jgi:hypothetical protein